MHLVCFAASQRQYSMLVPWRQIDIFFTPLSLARWAWSASIMHTFKNWEADGDLKFAHRLWFWQHDSSHCHLERPCSCKYPHLNFPLTTSTRMHLLFLLYSKTPLDHARARESLLIAGSTYTCTIDREESERYTRRWFIHACLCMICTYHWNSLLSCSLDCYSVYLLDHTCFRVRMQI